MQVDINGNSKTSSSDFLIASDLPKEIVIPYIHNLNDCLIYISNGRLYSGPRASGKEYINSHFIYFTNN